MAIISPSNTISGLTRPEPGARTTLRPERLYPSGERNFVRIATADHVAAAALVQLADELGSTRVFVLWDRDDPNLVGFPAGMRTAVAGRGLRLAGAVGWNPDARSFDGLAREIASTRPDAVLLAGAAPPRAGALIRRLRARLGRGPALIASDGFADFDALIADAGPAARGMYVSYYGIPNSKLPPAGRRFLKAFERPNPDFSAAYAAQATELLLDAIARSDGTRASVNRELRRSRSRGRHPRGHPLRRQWRPGRGARDHLPRRSDGRRGRSRAHGAFELTQRKPMWLIPVSIICGRRAAGR